MSDFTECEQFKDHRRQICRGEREDLGTDRTNAYRSKWGLPPLGMTQEEWDVSKPSRGLGDVVAKFTHATGLDVVAKAISTATGKPCGCGKRQAALNDAVPFNKGL